jgi:hypothetical protein
VKFPALGVGRWKAHLDHGKCRTPLDVRIVSVFSFINNLRLNPPEGKGQFQ